MTVLEVEDDLTFNQIIISQLAWLYTLKKKKDWYLALSKGDERIREWGKQAEKLSNPRLAMPLTGLTSPDSSADPSRQAWLH